MESVTGIFEIKKQGRAILSAGANKCSAVHVNGATLIHISSGEGPVPQNYLVLSKAFPAGRAPNLVTLKNQLPWDCICRLLASPKSQFSAHSSTKEGQGGMRKYLEATPVLL